MPRVVVSRFVPEVIERVTQKHPRISVYVVETQTAEQDFRELRERGVDLMLGRLLKPLTSEDVKVEVLCQDHFVVVTGAASPWATRKKIALKDLLNEQWILFPPSNVTGPYINRIFRGNGLEPPRVTVASYSMHLRLHLLSTGRFLTIVQDSVARYHAKCWSLKVLPIDTRRAPAPIAAFTLKNRTMSPVVHVFLEQARAVARSIP